MTQGMEALLPKLVIAVLQSCSTLLKSEWKFAGALANYVKDNFHEAAGPASRAFEITAGSVTLAIAFDIMEGIINGHQEQLLLWASLRIHNMV